MAFPRYAILSSFTPATRNTEINTYVIPIIARIKRLYTTSADIVPTGCFLTIRALFLYASRNLRPSIIHIFIEYIPGITTAYIITNTRITAALIYQ